MTTHLNPTLSIVIPIYNEMESLDLLERELLAFTSKLEISWEVLLINDGSSDGTDLKLNTMANKQSGFKVLHFSRNFGHQIAISAGIRYARGNAVVVMDGDLQDPFYVVHSMIEKWREGFEVVYAVRDERAGETWIKKLTASFFYKILAQLSKTPIPQNVGDFRLVDRKAVDAFNMIHEKNRFVRGLFAWIGYRQTSVHFMREARKSGSTKYPFRKMFLFALDGLFSFSDAPLRAVLWLGFWVAGLSFCAGIWSIAVKLLGQSVQGWTSLILVVCFASGVQLIVLGVIGEYIARIAAEVRNRPLFLIRDSKNFDPEELGR